MLDEDDYKFLHLALDDLKNDLRKLTLLQMAGHVPLIVATLASKQTYEVIFSSNTLNVLSSIEPQLLYFRNFTPTSKPDLDRSYTVIFGDIDQYIFLF